MIPIQFEEVELSRDYTDFARGGPVYETGVVGNARGVQQRNINAPHGVSEYEIQYAACDNFQLEQLDEFFRTKYGGAIGFRFYPPRDRNFKGDLLGLGTGGAVTFRLKRIYKGGGITVERRICKPVKDALVIDIGGSIAGLSDGAGGWYPPAWGDVGFGESIPTYVATVNWNEGTFTVTPNVPNGVEVRAMAGEYDIPVVFGQDRFEPTSYLTFHDLEGLKLIEQLPAALGIV